MSTREDDVADRSLEVDLSSGEFLSVNHIEAPNFPPLLIIGVKGNITDKTIIPIKILHVSSIGCGLQEKATTLLPPFQF